VFENREKREERVFVRVENESDVFFVNPEKPTYDRHPFLQGAINSLAIPKEFELDITLWSHVPTGISTGTSASICVALLGALDRLTSQRHPLDELVSLAHRVETEKLGLQSGIQDQICAAFGGICFINMYRYPKAHVLKLELEENIKQELIKRLCLIYLGETHSSSVVHDEVISFLDRESSQFKILKKLRALADRAKNCMLQGDLASFGKLMTKNNEYQRSLYSRLISREADLVIGVAKKYKAAGWKVNGAGGDGGSLTILGNQEKNLREQMLQEINTLGRDIRSIPISLNFSGLKVDEE